jgi:hypothetical protein
LGRGPLQMKSPARETRLRLIGSDIYRNLDLPTPVSGMRVSRSLM